ncbi:methyltransferase [Candidatus Dojkabacteria bacterium]|nr:methyltransferase [Candidatus Dojkabacteria bacterium]
MPDNESIKLYGLEFNFDPENVLEPTQFAVAFAKSVGIVVKNRYSLLNKQQRIIADVGAGSGVIAAILREDLDSEYTVLATDLSMDALRTAQSNFSRNDLSVPLVQADLLEAFGDGALDVIVSNPPFYESQSSEESSLPALAIDGGSDGMDFYRRLIEIGSKKLRYDGMLFMRLESGFDNLRGPLKSPMLKDLVNLASEHFSGADLYFLVRRKIQASDYFDMPVNEEYRVCGMVVNQQIGTHEDESILGSNIDLGEIVLPDSGFGKLELVRIRHK